MKILFTYLLIFSVSFQVTSQDIELETPLENDLAETSGLIYINSTLISHNDSGGNAELYEVDANTGNITRTVQVTNATNADWEDITHDDTYIYIGDFGNNNGTRTDLKIYRISIADYTNTMDNTVTADIINFSYDDQTDFTSSPFNTNFDAEALLYYQNNLYIFTKNWIDSKTNIYVLPKNPGTYSIAKVDTIDTEGLVTAAAYYPELNQIVMIGYNTSFQPFIMVLENVVNDMFSEYIYTRTNINPPNSIQIEGVTQYDGGFFYVSAEDTGTNNQALYDMIVYELLNTSSHNNSTTRIHPNPTNSALTISTTNFKLAKIYSIEGKLILTSKTSHIDISNLSSGTYLVVIESEHGKETKKIIIN